MPDVKKSDSENELSINLLLMTSGGQNITLQNS